MPLDLHNSKYSRDILKQHIYEVKLLDIVKTQVIDADFVVKYILNKKYQLCKEEEEITAKIVLQFQPHITYHELQEAINNYDTDNDSIEDFETVSNKK